MTQSAFVDALTVDYQAEAAPIQAAEESKKAKKDKKKKGAEAEPDPIQTKGQASLADNI